jgi:hypothetical protein
MIENFYIVCRGRDEKLEKIIGSIRNKYLKDCEKSYDYHTKLLFDILQCPEESSLAKDAKDHFD